MKDVLMFFILIVVSHFLFSGEPTLYDLLHKRAVEAASITGVRNDQ